jgi:putative sterol carrier protein
VWLATQLAICAKYARLTLAGWLGIIRSMTTASDKLKQMSDKIAENKSQAASIGAVFKFALEGAGGGDFIVNLKDNPGVAQGDGAADCTIRMTAQDFVDLTEGKANGQQLFFTGRLKVEGDMSLALRLQSLMDIVK